MIKHISMGRFKERAEGMSKKENMEKVRELSYNLKRIPEMKSIEIGFNFLDAPNAYDFVSVSEYEDMEAVKMVVANALHDELVDFLKKVTEETHAVTYEI
jgi:hypothetical protein